MIGASLPPCRDKGRGDGGEGDANFRREISAMMTVRRGLKLRRVFTSRPVRGLVAAMLASRDFKGIRCKRLPIFMLGADHACHIVLYQGLRHFPCR